MEGRDDTPFSVAANNVPKGEFGGHVGDRHERGVEGRDDTPDSVAANNVPKGEFGGHVGESTVRRAHAKCNDGSQTSCVGQVCFRPSWKRFGSAAVFDSTAAPFFGGAAAAISR